MTSDTINASGYILNINKVLTAWGSGFQWIHKFGRSFLTHEFSNRILSISH